MAIPSKEEDPDKQDASDVAVEPEQREFIPNNEEKSAINDPAVDQEPTVRHRFARLTGCCARLTSGFARFTGRLFPYGFKKSTFVSTAESMSDSGMLMKGKKVSKTEAVLDASGSYRLSLL